MEKQPLLVLNETVRIATLNVQVFWQNSFFSLLNGFNPSRLDPGGEGGGGGAGDGGGLNWIFIFALLFRASKVFRKAFIKPFEAPQRSVKVEIDFYY